jgi:hypothetical protein
MVNRAVTGEAEANTTTILELVGKIWYNTDRLKNGRGAPEPLLECISELLSVLGITDDDEVQRLLGKIRSGLVLQLASMYFKPKLKPKLKKLHIQWVDVLPVLKEQIGSVEKLQQAKTNPNQLLREVVKVGVQRLLQQLWHGDKEGQEIVRIVTEAATGEEIYRIGALEHRPPAILELVGKIWDHTHKFEEESLRKCISELLSVIGITNGDDNERLLGKIRSGLVLYLASMYFKPTLELKLQEHRLEWADVLPVLKGRIDSVEKLQEAMKNPDQLLEAIADPEVNMSGPAEDSVGQFLPQVDMSGPAAKKQAIEDLQSKPEPTPQEHKLGWPDLLPLLETTDFSVVELKAALALLEKKLANTDEPAVAIVPALALLEKKLANMDEPAVAIVPGQKLQEVITYPDPGKERRRQCLNQLEKAKKNPSEYWNFSNSADGAPPGPRWMSLEPNPIEPEAFTSSSGRKQLLV